jgi:hypothetical protein
MPPKRQEVKGGKSIKQQAEADEEAQPLEEQGVYIFEAHGNATYDGQVQRRDGGVMRRHGRGTYTDKHITYTGDWRDDQMTSDAAVVKFAATGATYEGTVVDGKFEGRGTYKWADGSCYTGQWRANRMHGEGTYRDAAGMLWSGRFYNGTGPGLRQPSAAANAADSSAKAGPESQLQ